MNLLNNYILVKKIEKKESDGFELAEAVNELIGKGKVIETPINITIPTVGSTVYFEKSLGTEFEINGIKVKFVKLEDIMGYEEYDN